MLRRSWLIFATAAAEAGQPLLLPQRRGQPHLELVQRRLGLAQLARAALGRDDPARVLGVVAVGGHVLDHPADRPHDQPLHREEEQRRRGERDRPARCRGCAAPGRSSPSRSGHSCSVTSISLCAPWRVAADDPDDPVVVGEEDRAARRASA